VKIYLLEKKGPRDEGRFDDGRTSVVIVARNSGDARFIWNERIHDPWVHYSQKCIGVANYRARRGIVALSQP